MVRYSPDVRGGQNAFRRERIVIAYDAALRMMMNAIRQDKDVVIDECNLYAPRFSLFVARAQQLRANVKWQIIKADPDRVKEECRKRGVLCDADIDLLMEKYGQQLK